jgi:hypothetical protein
MKFPTFYGKSESSHIFIYIHHIFPDFPKIIPKSCASHHQPDIDRSENDDRPMESNGLYQGGLEKICNQLFLAIAMSDYS